MKKHILIPFTSIFLTSCSMEMNSLKFPFKGDLQEEIKNDSITSYPKVKSDILKNSNFTLRNHLKYNVPLNEAGFSTQYTLNRYNRGFYLSLISISVTKKDYTTTQKLLAYYPTFKSDILWDIGSQSHYNQWLDNVNNVFSPTCIAIKSGNSQALKLLLKLDYEEHFSLEGCNNAEYDANQYKRKHKVDIPIRSVGELLFKNSQLTSQDKKNIISALVSQDDYGHPYVPQRSIVYYIYKYEQNPYEILKQYLDKKIIVPARVQGENYSLLYDAINDKGHFSYYKKDFTYSPHKMINLLLQYNPKIKDTEKNNILFLAHRKLDPRGDKSFIDSPTNKKLFKKLIQLGANIHSINSFTSYDEAHWRKYHPHLQPYNINGRTIYSQHTIYDEAIESGDKKFANFIKSFCNKCSIIYK